MLGIRPYRYAASIILASNFRRPMPSVSTPDHSGTDLAAPVSVLTVKRKPNSSSMPSSVVFPGGALDEADFNSDYAFAYKEIFLTLRKSRGLPSSDDEWTKHISNIQETGHPKAPAYTVLRQLPVSANMPPEWAFRVCGLRELFEECGILIGYCLNESRYVALDGENSLRLTSADKWEAGRRLVRESAAKFLDVSMQQLGVVPAFWLLEEWSNWLAPNTYRQRSRFDTIFYICCLDETPRAAVHVGELDSSEWINPNRALADAAKNFTVLAPPQVYELSRLANFLSMNELREFLAKRLPHGLIRFLPYLASSAEGRRLCFLPGDDLYPENMDEVASDVPIAQLKESAQELRSKCMNLHRAEFDFINGQYTNGKIYMSVKPSCGHVAPVLSCKSNL